MCMLGIDTHRPDTKGKREETLTSRTGTADKTGYYQGRYDSTGKEMTLCQLYLKQNAQEANVKKKHNEAQEQLHAVIERGQVGC